MKKKFMSSIRGLKRKKIKVKMLRVISLTSIHRDTFIWEQGTGLQVTLKND